MSLLLPGSSHIRVFGLPENKKKKYRGAEDYDKRGKERSSRAARAAASEADSGTATTASEEPTAVEEYEYIGSIQGIHILQSRTMPELGGQEVQHGSPRHKTKKGNGTLRSSQSDDTMIRKLDRFGFIMNVDANGNVCEAGYEEGADEKIPTFAEAKRTERRERKWSNTMDSWERRRPRVLLRRLRKGIPDSLRGRVWVMLGGGIREPGLYDEIVRKTAAACLVGDDVETEKTAGSSDESENKSTSASKATTQGSPKKASSPYRGRDSDDSDDYIRSKAFKSTQDTIERDIHRTYPRHNLFYEDDRGDNHITSGGTDEADILMNGFCDPELVNLISSFESEVKSGSKASTPQNTPGGQCALRRVLRAYSYYDREVGYCQGMNFIAGMFLTIMSEEDAFWLLVAVMGDKPCKMRGLFGEGMRETHKVLHVAERLTQQFLPKLFKHFEKENIHVTMYATQWLLTQYTSSFKFDLVTRVWDCFLGEGWKIIYRVMLAILSQFQTQLLRMSFEEILSFFRELPDRVEGSVIIESALKISLRKKHIVKYEKEWLARQTDER